jgi:cytochrome oxidase Cu insertion factor (SCO1/SenC/PrrC family)
MNKVEDMNEFMKEYLRNKYKAQGRFDLINELDKPVKPIKNKRKYNLISANHIKKLKNLEKMKKFLEVERSKFEIQKKLKITDRSVLTYLKELKKEGKVIEKKVYSGKPGGYSKLFRWVKKK